MGINRKIRTASVVRWNGEEAAQVRGLSSNDIAVILEREGTDLRAVLDALDEADLSGVDVGNTDQVAGALARVGPGLVVELARRLPRFLATVIAVAADADDETIEEDVQHISTDWPVPLQFLALTEIASLTFSGPEGFRAFVGNVLALGGLTKVLTGAGNNTGTAAQIPSENGSQPYSS